MKLDVDDPELTPFFAGSRAGELRIPRCDACPLAAECPSRGRRYEPLRNQSRFQGSFRQRRADTLRLVAAAPRRSAALDSEVVAALARDGLVQEDEGVVRLPA